MIWTVNIGCPYCGESFDTAVEAGQGETEYTEDCQVCCQPIFMRVRVGLDCELLEVEARREND